jgi:activating signal cointegrator 1
MKALSLRQPWATLIALGEKQYETRSWSTNYRGQIAIQAAKRMQPDQFEWCAQPTFLHALSRHGIMIRDLPLGSIVAIVDIVAVYHTEDIAPRLSREERAFGNYANGRFAWELHLVHRILKPIPVRGAQGLFEIDDDLIKPFL